ncbi:J domain-containing protein [Patulibacter minatonensis]|uniref:J domain-containing protein n=1 Tax=Patulibacter minatonensis TaxID=298163 RepID=UPI00047DF710|nr:J domain-containing protein [Patulibacter minatonensis]
MAVPSGVDPHEVLGVTSGAPPADVTAAYRRLAKRWHPDRAPSAEAADRMALINAAYDQLRDAAERAASGAPDATGPVPRTSGSAGAPSWPPRGTAGPWEDREPPSGRARTGAAGEGLGPDVDPRAPWTPGLDGRLHVPGGDPGPSEVHPGPRDGLAPAVRRALGLELRTALEPGETVGLVVPATTWASPQTTLVVTDRRILYLLDDAPVHRVRVLPLADVTDVRVRPPRPWRGGAQVACTDRRGRRTTFGDLPPATAAAVARRVRAGAARTGA